ncbi:MAG: DUF6273 domain-containing protein [Coriobacteriales bacterium]|nr:DUF6273 domain-containing protein [Coriobacteriales bacterium]
MQVTHFQAMEARPENKNLAIVSGVVRRASFAEYSWAGLKVLPQMIAAVRSDAEGLAIAKAYCLVDKDGLLQGDEKPLELKGGTKTSVRILGFRHDELAAGGIAGISLEFANVSATHRMNPSPINVGGWEKSEMRSWLNEDYFAKLPDDLRPLVEPAWKLTNNVGRVRKENDVSVVRRNADGPDRLWLLSLSEVYGSFSSKDEDKLWSPSTYDAEGAQYQLYESKEVSTTSYSFCKKDGAYSLWWLRSLLVGNSNSFHCVYRDGGWDGWIFADRGWGVSPGFCF